MQAIKKTRVAVVGLGNVGKGALDAIETAPDMELAGIVVREHRISGLRKTYPAVAVVSDIRQLEEVDVTILAAPSRSVPELAQEVLALGICTVDSFDIHGQELWQLRQDLEEVARAAGAVAISAAGWDPGTDSMIRAIFAMQAPRGISYTNFGPGMSMGHTVAAKQIPGVKNALSMTLPQGLGQHKRAVYVELEPEAELAAVKEAVLRDPYFSHDETQVLAVADVEELMDFGHGVLLERRGVAGKTGNQVFRYESRMTNPAVTGQVLVSAARATQRLPAGAYTMLEVPLACFLPGELQDIVERLV
jgi:diaminopimelate dehydrogenase